MIRVNVNLNYPQMHYLVALLRGHSGFLVLAIPLNSTCLLVDVKRVYKAIPDSYPEPFHSVLNMSPGKLFA